MDLKEFKEKYPDIAKALNDEGEKSGFDRGFKEGEKAGIEKASEKNQDTAKTEEKNRIVGLVNIQFGEDAGETFKSVVETGVTIDQFAAIQKTQPKQKSTGSQAEMLEAIHKAGAGDVGHGDQQTGTGKDFLVQVDEHVALHKCSKTIAMQEVIKKDSGAHEAYLKSVN